MIGDYHYLSIDGMCNHLILSMVERVVHPATYSNSYKLLLYPSTHLTEEPYIMLLYYSDQALKMGYYSANLYYDRGVAYEATHEYSKAKKWYKKALRKGYNPARYALTQCKINQKEWKKFHK